MRIKIEVEENGVTHSITRCISDMTSPEFAQEDVITALNKVLFHAGVPEVDIP